MSQDEHLNVQSIPYLQTNKKKQFNGLDDTARGIAYNNRGKYQYAYSYAYSRPRYCRSTDPEELAQVSQAATSFQHSRRCRRTTVVLSGEYDVESSQQYLSKGPLIFVWTSGCGRAFAKDVRSAAPDAGACQCASRASRTIPNSARRRTSYGCQLGRGLRAQSYLSTLVLQRCGIGRVNARRRPTGGGFDSEQNQGRQLPLGKNPPPLCPTTARTWRAGVPYLLEPTCRAPRSNARQNTDNMASLPDF